MASETSRHDDLRDHIRETRKALERGRELLSKAGTRGMTDGVKKLIEATPRRMKQLEDELEQLEKALSAEIDERTGG